MVRSRKQVRSQRRMIRCRKLKLDIGDRQRRRRNNYKTDSSNVDINQTVQSIVNEIRNVPHMHHSPISNFENVQAVEQNLHSINLPTSSPDFENDNTDKIEMIEKTSPNIDNIPHFKNGLSVCLSKMDHVLGKQLLNHIRTHSCFSKLPKDPRSLLQTPRKSCEILKIAGGEYAHFGFEKALQNILQRTPFIKIPTMLEIDINVDGAALDSRGKISVWPIQIRVANIPSSKPEPVGVWKGSGTKPTNAIEFLKPFVDDVLNVLNIGVEYGGKLLSTKLRCVIADAPGRAMLLGHTGHHALIPCSRCKVMGRNIRKGVTVYNSINDILRTDIEYSQRLDGSHFTDDDCPIGRLPIGLSTQVPFEYMHTVCLGVMRRILAGIIDGRFGTKIKVTPNIVQIMSSRLLKISKYCPTVFSRHPSLIDKHTSWKATELRQFLLYSGVVVLFQTARRSVYVHFLLLHVAMRILAKPRRSEDDYTFAQKLINIFVSRSADVFGIEFVSYVVHTLLHIVEDSRRFGSLDEFSAFPYENNMQYFTKICRKQNQQLQQMNNRRQERENVKRFQKNEEFNDSGVICSKEHNEGPIVAFLSYNCPTYSQHRRLRCKEFEIHLNGKNDTIMTKNSSICIVQNIIRMDENILLIVKKFESVSELYTIMDVINSSAVDEFLCTDLAEDLTYISLHDVRGVCFRMPYYLSIELSLREEPVPETFAVSLLLSSTAK